MEWNNVNKCKPNETGYYLVIIDGIPTVRRLCENTQFKDVSHWIEIKLPRKEEELTPEQAYERAMKVL